MYKSHIIRVKSIKINLIIKYKAFYFYINHFKKPTKKADSLKKYPIIIQIKIINYSTSFP